MLVVALATAAAQEPDNITYTGHRPLAGALDQLERILGVPLNYEDVPYGHRADLQDVAPAHWRVSSPGAPFLVPRTGTVSASVQTHEKASLPSARQAAETLIDSYRQNQLPGDFRVEEANHMLYVVATRATPADGAAQQVTSPTLARVTVPFGERRLIEGMSEVLRAAGKVSGVRIDVGQLPESPVRNISFGAKDEPLRDLIARLLAEMGVSASYRLLYDPVLRYYMLNFNRPVPNAQPAPAGMAPPAPSPEQPTNGLGNASPYFSRQP